MNGFCAARWGAALGILLVLATACSSPLESGPAPVSPPSPAPVEHTVAELCDALLTYFRDDLGIVDLQIAAEHELSTPLRVAGRCYVAAGSERVGSVSISHEENADRTEAGTPYHRLDGVSGRAWVSDIRPYGPLIYLLYDNESRVSLLVNESAARTSTGPLTLTDDQVRRTAEFGFTVARTLAGG